MNLLQDMEYHQLESQAIRIPHHMISNGYLPREFHPLLAELPHVLVDPHLVKTDSHSKAHLQDHPLHLVVIRIEMVEEAEVTITREAATKRGVDPLIKTVVVPLIKTVVVITGTTITGIIGMRNPNGIIGIITEIIIIIRDVPANFSLSMALVVMEIVADLHTNNNLLETRWMF